MKITYLINNVKLEAEYSDVEELKDNIYLLKTTIGYLSQGNLFISNTNKESQKSQEFKPITAKQLEYLKDLGYSGDTSNMSAQEASEKIDELSKKRDKKIKK